jgi:predicted O-methyltransferase YrrM
MAFSFVDPPCMARAFTDSQIIRGKASMIKNLALTETLREYLLSVSLREPDILRRLREETASLPKAHMQIVPEQGQFMGLLARLMRAERVLEVGVFTGYSSLCLALALPPEGRLTALDISEEWTAVARRYWAEAGMADKIDLRLGPASDSLAALLAGGNAGRYDLAFIDADKPNYDAYFELTLQLLRPGGLLLVDNVLWNGQAADPTDTSPETVAIRALNAKLHADPRIEISMLPIADGLTLALKQ